MPFTEQEHKRLVWLRYLCDTARVETAQNWQEFERRKEELCKAK